MLAYEKPQIGGGSVNHYDPTVKMDGPPLTEGFISLQSGKPSGRIPQGRTAEPGRVYGSESLQL